MTLGKEGLQDADWLTCVMRIPLDAVVTGADLSLCRGCEEGARSSETYGRTSPAGQFPFRRMRKYSRVGRGARTAPCHRTSPAQFRWIWRRRVG
ncbi:unnamed protein product [Urochloa humidicola]